MKLRTWGIYLKALLFFILYFGLTILLSYYLGLLVEERFGIEKHYFTGLFTSTLMLICCIYLFKQKADKNVFSFIKLSTKVIFSIAIISILFFISGDIIINNGLIFGIYDYPKLENMNISLERNIIYILRKVVMIPIFEELFFRGILLGLFLKTKKMLLPILFTSLLFAVTHINPLFIFESLSGVFYSFLLGILACYIYLKTKNIIYPILLHIANNFLSYLLKNYNQEYWGLIKSLEFDYRYWLLIIASTVLLIFTLTKLPKKI